MSRVYTVTTENVTASAAQDLFEITPADDKPVAFWGLHIHDVGGTADAGDAQEEKLRVLVRRGHTTSGSGGSAPTPRPLDGIDTAAGFTAEANNTTVATVGTTHDLHADGWNVRIPYVKTWLPETRPKASQADTTMLARLVAAPADALALSITLEIAEGI